MSATAFDHELDVEKLVDGDFSLRGPQGGDYLIADGQRVIGVYYADTAIHPEREVQMIQLAVNSYQPMLEALKGLLIAEKLDDDDSRLTEARDKAQAAIALAEGQPVQS